MIKAASGEMIFDNFSLMPHMQLNSFKSNFPQKEILAWNTYETPGYGKITDIYLKPQKSENKYFVLRLNFAEREVGLFHFILSIQWNDTIPQWENWSEAQQLQNKKDNDNWLQKEIGSPPYEFSWGCIRSVYDQREGSSYVAVNYK